MSETVKFTKNWWLLTIIGISITLLGFWVYTNPIENYIALSVLFSMVIFVSGIFEIIFAISNSKLIRGWGWMLTSGIFDLIIGIILLTKENITMSILPFIFGIWLVFRGISQVSRGILIKQAHFKNWGWSIVGGFFVVLFGFMVIYSPQFGVATIIIWTALSLIILGLLTILFSFLVKKFNNIL
jgi:uncharacterized membrane protein HdeD (DUF308 family)